MFFHHVNVWLPDISKASGQGIPKQNSKQTNENTSYKNGCSISQSGQVLGFSKNNGKISEYQQLKGLVSRYKNYLFNEPSAGDLVVSWHWYEAKQALVKTRNRSAVLQSDYGNSRKVGKLVFSFFIV